MKMGKLLMSSMLMAAVFTIGLAFSGVGAFAGLHGEEQRQSTPAANAGKPDVPGSQSQNAPGSQGQNAPGSQGQGITITKTPEILKIEGLPSNVEDIQTRNVSGSADGTLRINWGGGNLSGNVGGTPMTPPGAPELPANVLFGTGFLFLGFGLLLYRKLW